MASKVTRRDFVKIAAAGIAAAVLAGCQTPRRWVSLEPYVRPPEEQLNGVATWYASTCRQCPAGCGILVRVMNGRALKIEGNPEHPLNQGKLCAHGQAGLQLLYNPDRLSGPVRQTQRGTRQYQPITWDEALSTLQSKVQSAGSRLAIWAGLSTSGHLYDLLGRFANALGAPAPLSYDLRSSLVGYPLLHDAGQQVFGTNELPVYDLGNADVIFSFGADFLSTGLSPVRYGVEWGNFRSTDLNKRGYMVQFEPRMTMTGAKADAWLPIRPGTEGLVAQALAALIAEQDITPPDRAERARTVAGTVDVESIAAASELGLDELTRLARVFAGAQRPLAIPGSALGGQDNAAGSLAAVQALNIIAGTIGQPGGLAPAAGLPSPSLSRPVAAPYSDVQKLIEQMRAGQVAVLLVYGANPVYELPEQAGFLDAVKQVPTVVSFAPLVDETAVWADLILPERTYLESWGYEVVSPSFGLPVVSSQQPVVQPFTDVRSTGDVLLTVARGIGPAAQALPWSDEVAFLQESIGQLPPGANGGSGPDVLWTRFVQHGGWWPTAAPTQAIPAPAPAPVQAKSSSFQGSDQDYPYFLYLFMPTLLADGRGANLPWLQGSPEPMTTESWQTWVEINPTTADILGLRDGDIIRVTSPYGEVEAPLYTYPAIRPDTVAIPFGQGHTDLGRYARGRGSNPLKLIGTQTEATGKSLAWATVRVKIARTGKRAALAIFENKVGVTQGFINQAFPGQ